MFRRWVTRLVLLGAVGAAAWWLLQRRRGSAAPAESTERVFAPVVIHGTAAASAATWVDGPDDGSCPPGYPIKVNTNSGIYHVPGGRSYDRTTPQRCYATAADAEADGYRRAKA